MRARLRVEKFLRRSNRGTSRQQRQLHGCCLAQNDYCISPSDSLRRNAHNGVDFAQAEMKILLELTIVVIRVRTVTMHSIRHTAYDIRQMT